ncbi:hypothetical protein M9H77_28021 [Catharanthus roseus]|uniref:Uncharacterized protein n=1 Tax=Catharanthus roseus TaxID=4058 RepID=A0ACC0AIG1_CATRO|nr:hypothetical protein M9H77_28021 [Catharanthus roseus]
MDKKGQKERGFFKYFVPERSAQKLNIPRAYTLYKKGNLPAKVFLRDRYGNLWTVDVEKIGNELFLVGGWSTFVLENSLELGDFVVFEPGSHNTFNVKILGKNSVEKVGLGVCKSKIKIEEEESAEEEDGEEEEESAGSAEEEDEEEDIVILSSGPGESSGRNKTLKPSISAAKISKAGCRISPPKNPHFLAKMRPRRRDELFVPFDVINDYNLDLPSKTILRDSEGREWTTKLTPWKDGRIWYYGGWASLCRVNRVNEADTCLCEFVKRKGKKKYHIQVTILRDK